MNSLRVIKNFLFLKAFSQISYKLIIHVHSKVSNDTDWRQTARGQMMRTLCLPWKVVMGRSINSSEPKVWRKFFHLSPKTYSGDIYGDEWQMSDQTPNHKISDVRFKRTLIFSDSFHTRHINFHEVVACSLLSIIMIKPTTSNSDSLRRHEDILPYI